MCGISAIASNKEISSKLYRSLLMLDIEVMILVV